MRRVRAHCNNCEICAGNRCLVCTLAYVEILLLSSSLYLSATATVCPEIGSVKAFGTMITYQQLVQCGLVWRWALLRPRKIHAYTCAHDHKHMARKANRKDLDSRPRKFEQKHPTLLAAGVENSSAIVRGVPSFSNSTLPKLLTNTMAWFLTRWIVSCSTTATP